MTLTLAFLAALAMIITSQVGQLASDFPRYEATIEAKVASIREGALGRLSRMADNVGRQIERATESDPANPKEQAQEGPRPLPVEVHSPELTPVQVAQRFILPVLHPLATSAITFVVLIFILLQREDLRDRVIRLFGSRDLHRTTLAMDDAAIRLSRYFLTQVALSAAYGVLTTIFLWAIGVPSPILCGVLAAIMRFVPYVGSIIAAAFPMLLAVAVDPGWTTLLLTGAFFLIGEPAMGYIVEPLVYGQSTGLSPFAVILSTIFWSWLWGPMGLILAMPLTLCLVVLGRHVEQFQFLDVILGDRPPLQPPQNFYQRMLAEDPDEALEQAEQILKERSLTTYYDEVALPGLMLAARDAGRGVLTSDNIQAIRSGVEALIADLAGTPDVEPQDGRGRRQHPRASRTKPQLLPGSWRADGAVLCVAGRGPLDEAASAILADVLRKHGFGADRRAPWLGFARAGAGHRPDEREARLRLLSGAQRSAGASALSAAPAQAGAAARARGRRPLACRRRHSFRRFPARARRRRPLRDDASGRSRRLPEGSARLARGGPEAQGSGRPPRAAAAPALALFRRKARSAVCVVEERRLHGTRALVAAPGEVRSGGERQNVQDRIGPRLHARRGEPQPRQNVDRALRRGEIVFHSTLSAKSV